MKSDSKIVCIIISASHCHDVVESLRPIYQDSALSSRSDCVNQLQFVSCTLELDIQSNIIWFHKMRCGHMVNGWTGCISDPVSPLFNLEEQYSPGIGGVVRCHLPQNNSMECT